MSMASDTLTALGLTPYSRIAVPQLPEGRRSSMNAIERFRDPLKAGRVCLGASITLSDPLVSDGLGGSVGFLWIDLEHSNMSPEALNGHLLAARARRVPGIVRVPGGGAAFIKPVLDSGADGIVVPQVRSAEEVRQVVSDCRHPRAGRHGYGPRMPSNYGRNGRYKCVDRANRAVFVAVHIGNLEALAGRICPGAPVRIVKETPSTAIVDCGFNFGPVTATRLTARRARGIWRRVFRCRRRPGGLSWKRQNEWE